MATANSLQWAEHLMVGMPYLRESIPSSSAWSNISSILVQREGESEPTHELFLRASSDKPTRTFPVPASKTARTVLRHCAFLSETLSGRETPWTLHTDEALPVARALRALDAIQTNFYTWRAPDDSLLRSQTHRGEFFAMAWNVAAALQNLSVPLSESADDSDCKRRVNYGLAALHLLELLAAAALEGQVFDDAETQARLATELSLRAQLARVQLKELLIPVFVRRGKTRVAADCSFEVAASYRQLYNTLRVLRDAGETLGPVRDYVWRTAAVKRYYYAGNALLLCLINHESVGQRTRYRALLGLCQEAAINMEKSVNHTKALFQNSDDREGALKKDPLFLVREKWLAELATLKTALGECKIAFGLTEETHVDVDSLFPPEQYFSEWLLPFDTPTTHRPESATALGWVWLAAGVYASCGLLQLANKPCNFVQAGIRIASGESGVVAYHVVQQLVPLVRAYETVAGISLRGPPEDFRVQPEDEQRDTMVRRFAILLYQMRAQERRIGEMVGSDAYPSLAEFFKLGARQVKETLDMFIAHVFRDKLSTKDVLDYCKVLANSKTRDIAAVADYDKYVRDEDSIDPVAARRIAVMQRDIRNEINHVRALLDDMVG